MSTTCGFGQVKDLRLKSLCMGSTQVIDGERNANFRDISTKNTTVRKDLVVQGDTNINGLTIMEQDTIVCGNLDVKGQITGEVASVPQETCFYVQSQSGTFNFLTDPINMFIDSEIATFGSTQCIWDTGGVIFNETGVFKLTYSAQMVIGSPGSIDGCITVQGQAGFTHLDGASTKTPFGGCCPAGLDLTYIPINCEDIITVTTIGVKYLPRAFYTSGSAGWAGSNIGRLFTVTKLSEIV